MKTLKNDKDEMVKIAPDDFKVFVRMPKGTSMMQISSFIKQLKAESKVTLIPEGWSVIVVRGNGTTDKL